MEQQLCDKCIAIIKDRLNVEQVLILQYLKQEKTINANLSKDRINIIYNIKDMTEMKFHVNILALELVGFVGRIDTKYYITRDGRKAVTLYEKEIRDELSTLEE